MSQCVPREIDPYQLTLIYGCKEISSASFKVKSGEAISFLMMVAILQTMAC